MLVELGSNLRIYWSADGPLVNWFSFNGKGNYEEEPITTNNSDHFLLTEMQEVYSGDVSTAHASKTTPQYFFHKGMKLFGEEGRVAIKKEIKENLLGMDAVNIVAPGDLDSKLYKDELPYLMFPKCKRTGKVTRRLRWFQNQELNLT